MREKLSSVMSVFLERSRLGLQRVMEARRQRFTRDMCVYADDGGIGGGSLAPFADNNNANDSMYSYNQTHQTSKEFLFSVSIPSLLAGFLAVPLSTYIPISHSLTSLFF